MATMAQAKRMNSLFIHLFVLFGPSVDWMMPVRLEVYRRVIFPQSTYSNLISWRNAHIDTPRPCAIPAIWASWSLAKLIHEVKHHRELTWLKFKLTWVSFPLCITSTTSIHPYPSAVYPLHVISVHQLTMVPRSASPLVWGIPSPVVSLSISSPTIFTGFLYFPLFHIILKYTPGL